MKDALSILEPMINDPVNYVRQGALLASAMLLVQQNDHLCPKVRKVEIWQFQNRRKVFCCIVSVEPERMQQKKLII